MKLNRLFWMGAFCLACWSGIPGAGAAVPHTLNYQGRVVVGGTNYTGTGQFKFALVDGGTNTAAAATASATVSYGFLVSISVTGGGSGYTAAPKVTITDATGSGAVATATVSGGAVTGITISNPGSGYSAGPVVTVAPPPDNIVCQTFWSNDGSSSGGSAPAQAVSVPVSQGLYSVLLGDTGLANMSAIPYAVFANSDVRLRVWFNDGTHGWQQLAPDQRIAATGYAMAAQTVPDGSITGAKIAAGTITGSNIAAGSITSEQLAGGVVSGSIPAHSITGTQLTPTAAADSLGMGALVLMDNPGASNLTSAGYVNIGKQTVKAEQWSQPWEAPIFSEGSYLFWTGSDLMAIGLVDDNASSLAVAKYDLGTRTWALVATTGPAPSSRAGFSAVWTGSTVLVYGGMDFNTVSYLSDGAKYHPATATWTAISSVSAPSGRAGATALWTGSTMMIWGGQGAGSTPSDGAFYNPAANSWSAISTGTAYLSSPKIVWSGTEAVFLDFSGAVRYNPSAASWSAVSPITISGTSYYQSSSFPAPAVWTGTEAIIWNVSLSPSSSASGLRYNPSTNTWKLISATNSPGYSSMTSPYVVWSGSRMLVVSGSASGGSYNPSTDTWSSIAPSGLNLSWWYSTSNQAIWSGSTMLIWNSSAGDFDDGYYDQGGIYNPTSNSWTRLANTTAPSLRSQARSCWTGDSLLIWGGYSSGSSAWLTDGRLRPMASSTLWTVMEAQGAPVSKSAYSSVWTGSEWIVWGGSNGSALINTGARYNPSTKTWTAVSTTGAPSARGGHSAVWTGAEMIVWGGKNSSGSYLNDGARYNPATNAWTALPSGGAPAARTSHSALWSGSQMIVWGGNNGSYLNSGARYDAASNSWSALSTTGAPAGRINHTAAWSGNEMLIWGGETAVSSVTNTGARYNPSTDTWKTMSSSGAPSARTLHAGCWVTNKLIVWGGSGTVGGGAPLYGNGAYYSPAYDQWTAITTGSAPSARYGSAVSVDTFNGRVYLFGGNNGTGDLNDLYLYEPELNMFIYQKL